MLPHFIENLLPDFITNLSADQHVRSHQEVDDAEAMQHSLDRLSELEELIGGKVRITGNDGKELAPGTEDFDLAVTGLLNTERHTRMTPEDHEVIRQLACELAPLPGDQRCEAPAPTPSTKTSEQTIRI